MPKKTAATAGKPEAAAPKKRGRPSKASQAASSSTSVPEVTEDTTEAPEAGKRAAFAALRASVNNKFGQGSMMEFDDPNSLSVECISSGNPAIDRILGGGWPRGRIIEIYGVESGGKTTLALQALAEVIKSTNGYGSYVDVEQSLSPDYAQALGIDLSRISISQPNSGEEALEIVDMAIKSGSIDVVVLDSVAALVTKAELEGTMEDQQVGVQARLMGKAMRKINSAVKKSNCVVIFINQLREKVGVMGLGEKTTTPGGRALKFYASIRLDVRYIGKLKRGETFIGQEVTITCKKNKVAPPFKKCTLDLFYKNEPPCGFCPATSLLDEATDAGVVSKSASSYRYDCDLIGSGRLKARKVLLDNQNLYNQILNEVGEAA